MGIIDGWLRRRDRWLASAAFRSWAARFPLTRPLARRRARQLFDLCAGFTYTQVLLACARLDLFEQLADGPRTLQEIASGCRLEPAAASRLLEAAVSLRLLQRWDGGSYRLGELGATLLGNEGVLAMIRHHPLLYRDLVDPIALLRGELPATELGRFWGYAGRPGEGSALEPAAVAAYSELMAASQSLIAEQVIGAYRFARHRRILDVGGGEGAFLQAVAAAVPGLRLALFDLPGVADRARQRLAAAGLADRTTVHSGDFARDPLPEGADLITLVRVLHDHDEPLVRGLLQAVHTALPVGGRVLIAEPLAGSSGAETVGAAYFGMYLLAMGSGRARTHDELRALLGSAGFAKVRALKTAIPLQTSVLIAEKPG
ncbi:MAG: methyltransferase [Steroidobacteraceae bacterium]